MDVVVVLQIRLDPDQFEESDEELRNKTVLFTADVMNKVLEKQDGIDLISAGPGQVIKIDKYVR